jgi:hypothetical protein
MTLLTRESTPVATRHAPKDALPSVTPLAGDTIIYLIGGDPVEPVVAHKALRAGREVFYEAYETDLASERLLALLTAGEAYTEHAILAMRRGDREDRPMVEAELAALEAEAAA